MSTVNNGPQIVKSGLVLDLDASLVSSYSAIAVYSVQCYSTYNGGLRSANYTVQYSDDNSTWTTAFTGVMSNDSTCGIITGTNRNDSNYSKHRYWRYVEGGAVVGHHPRVSRIDFITKSGAIYNLTTYTTDNCADSGTYIVGTVTKDFGTTTWRDTSGNGYNGTLTSGPTFDVSNKGSILFNGSSQYVNVSSLITGNQSFSWGAWIYPIATGTPVFFGNVSTGLAMISYWDSANNKVRVGTYGADRLTSGTTILPSNWGYTFWTWDGTTLTSYTNGIADGTATGFSFNISNLYTTIGNAVNAQYFAGRIAQTLVYNRVLSAAEIMQNYQATKTKFGL